MRYIFRLFSGRKSFLLFFLCAPIFAVFGQVNIVSSNNVAVSNATSLTVTKPTSVAVGNVLIINVAQSGGTAFPAMSTDWTRITGSIGGNARAALFYKVATSADVSAYSYVITLGGTASARALIINCSGVDGLNPFDGVPTSISSSTQVFTTTSLSGITAVNASQSDLLLLLGQNITTRSSRTANATGYTLGNASAAEFYDSNSSINVTAAYIKKTTTDNTSGTGSYSVSRSAYLGGAIFALKPKKIFRTTTSGNWKNITTWQQSVDGGTTWTSATTYPTANDGSVTIQQGHSVTLVQNQTASSLNCLGSLSLGTYTLTGTVSFALGSNAILNISGANNFPSGFSSVTLDTASNVIYNGTTQTVSAQTYGNLSMQNGTKTLGAATAVAGVLNLSSTVVNTAGYILNVTNAATTAITGGSASAYVNGLLKRSLQSNLTSAAVYQFPVGSATKYYPFTLVNPQTGAGTVSAQVSVTENLSGATYNTSTLSSVNSSEYWTLTTSGNFTNSSVSVTQPTVISPNNVLAGATAATGQYQILYGTNSTYGVDASDAIGSYRYFTLAKSVPNVVVSVSSLSGFTYPAGAGPSATQSFTVRGTGLTGNISIVPPADFEVSLTDGTSFVAANPLTVSALSGTVAPANVYVRMKSGHAVGSVAAQDIAIGSTNVSTKNVSVSGTVYSAPTINVSPATLSGFTYVFSAGPSASQYFTVSGSNLLSDITVSAPADYEISLSSTSGFTSSLTLIQNGGYVSTTTIYARLKSSLGVGNYREAVQLTSSYAQTNTVSLSGTVTANATLMTSIAWLSGFIYKYGAGPSAEQSLTVVGSNLSGSVTITAPANFAISTTSGGGFTTGSLTLTPVSGSVNQKLYIIMSAGLAVGNYGPVNLSLNSTGATVKTVALSGSVVSSATISVSKSSMSGFGYLYNNGPSSVQSFTVSGASLTANVSLNAPANYEISLSSASSFGSALSLPVSGGLLAPTTVYIRLKSGLTANAYTGNISAVSTGATTKTVSLTGKVYASPLIAATGGGDYCNGSTISLASTGADVQNIYWSGPNSYYSTVNNPTIANATSANSGTYTVTGNVVVGGNLVVNGDFESGNVGFGSGYTYNSTSLWNESTYAVVANPNSVHRNFSACTDHTSGTGKQLVVNGSSVAGVVIWSQSVAVIPGADYEFSYWIQSVVAENPSQLQLYVNGVAAGPVYTANLATCSWKKFIYNTNAGTNTLLNLELINENTVASGNDFALDDIAFEQILSANSSVNVNVQSSLPLSVAVSYSPQTIYSGTPVTFTANVTNGGSTPSYVWKVNGDSVGNEINYTYKPQNGDVVVCQVTSSYACATGSPASDSITLTVIPTDNYWLGTNSTDWSDASNWTAGYVPLAGDNVEFATAENNNGVAAKNDLQLDQDRTIGSFVNETSYKLIIPVAKTLIVNNSVSSGTNAASASKILIETSADSANGSLIFNNAQNFPVYATVQMYSMATWDLTQTVGSKYNWQYFGIPLTAIQATPTFNGAYVRAYFESGTTMANHWQELENTSVLQPFVGYELCQQYPKTYTMAGQLVNSDFHSGTLAVTSGAIYPGQHLLANPYTAAINIRNIDFGPDMDATVYLYNTGTFNNWDAASTGKVGVGPAQYISVPKYQAGLAGIPQQVPSMGSMLVLVQSATDSAYVNINYNSVVMGNTDVMRVVSNKQNEDKTWTKINVQSDNYSDAVWIVSSDSYSKTFDNGNDGYKILGSAMSPQMYAVEADGNYQIDAVDNIDNTLLAFQAGVDTEYTLEFTHSDTETQTYDKMYLFDIVTNTLTDITENESTYKFSANSTTDPVHRFVITTKKIDTDQTNDADQMMSYVIDNKIYIQNLSAETGSVYLYDISGRLYGVKSVASNSVQSFDVEHYQPYILKTIVGNNTVTKKLVVK